MRVFIDESGTFDVPRRGQQAAAVAVAIAVSDATWPSLTARFREFVAGLNPEELEESEPKGRLLSPQHLLEFAGLLSEFDGVVVTPVTMDLGHLAGMNARDLVEPLRFRLEEQVGQMVFPEAAEQVDPLARQARNLSPQQLLRLLTWTRALYESLHHAIVFLSRPQLGYHVEF